MMWWHTFDVLLTCSTRNVPRKMKWIAIFNSWFVWFETTLNSFWHFTLFASVRCLACVIICHAAKCDWWACKQWHSTLRILSTFQLSFRSSWEKKIYNEIWFQLTFWHRILYRFAKLIRNLPIFQAHNQWISQIDNKTVHKHMTERHRQTDTNSTCTLNKQRTVYLPYNLIVASMPPILFFDMHLYPPKSGLCKCFMVSVIWIAYIELSVSCIVYLSFGIIISPIVVDIVVMSRGGGGGGVGGMLYRWNFSRSSSPHFIIQQRMDLVRLVLFAQFSMIPHQKPLSSTWRMSVNANAKQMRRERMRDRHETKWQRI